MQDRNARRPRSRYRRRRIPRWAPLIPIGYIACLLAVRIDAGPLAAWAIGVASLGLIAVVAAVMLTTGYSAAHHAERERRAIAAIEATRTRRKELTS